MKAARYHGRRDVRVDAIPTPACGADEVRVQVAYCGICGSDLHEYLGGPIFSPHHGETHPYNGASLPITMGHELSGTIVEVGEDSSSSQTVAGANAAALRVGQRVVVDPCIRDRQLGTAPCVACANGTPNVCARLGFHGLNGPGGGLSEYLLVKAVSVWPLPDAIPLRVGALVEPLSVAWHCVRISGIRRGQDAVVLGAGPIGLALLLVLRAWGVRTVIVSEPLDARRELAVKYGADFVVDPTANKETKNKKVNGASTVASLDLDVDPVVVKARETSGNNLGGGADVAFDATGVQTTLDTSIACVRQGGTILNVAIHEKPLSLNLNALALSEKRLMGGLCFTDEDFRAVIGALEDGSLVADGMVTAVVPLEDAVRGAFEELAVRREKHVKILVQPNAMVNGV